MPEISFEVYCKCGNGLCSQSTVGFGRYGAYITVEPCEKCLEKAVADAEFTAHDEGYTKGYADAERSRE